MSLYEISKEKGSFFNVIKSPNFLNPNYVQFSKDAFTWVELPYSGNFAPALCTVDAVKSDLSTIVALPICSNLIFTCTAPIIFKKADTATG
jgi:hypothetical protein